MTVPATHATPLTPQDVVDVSHFAVLATLAMQHGLPWTRSDARTYVVQDGGTTYRYRSDAGAPYVVVPAATCLAEPERIRIDSIDPGKGQSWW